ncbi:MAG: hypothetical protein QOF21_1833 [Actinomycetota bacterium]|jgi:anti-anti-sigma factor
MARTDTVSLATMPAGVASTLDQSGAHTTVSLHGEHDASNSAQLSDTLARAIAITKSDLVVDLSDVDFMGCATVGVIARAGEFLQARSLALIIRAPSRSACRVLALCGYMRLPESNVIPLSRKTAALATWVAVPVEVAEP